jgi:hypothetical protein
MRVGSSSFVFLHLLQSATHTAVRMDSFKLQLMVVAWETWHIVHLCKWPSLNVNAGSWLMLATCLVIWHFFGCYAW